MKYRQLSNLIFRVLVSPEEPRRVFFVEEFDCQNKETGIYPTMAELRTQLSDMIGFFEEPFLHGCGLDPSGSTTYIIEAPSLAAAAIKVQETFTQEPIFEKLRP